MYEQLQRGVQRTENDMISHPNDKKPACPIEAVEHERSAKNCENPRDPDKAKFNGTLCDELGQTLRGGFIHQWQQASKKCDAAEGYEYPTDDRDGARTFIHPRL